ncbi:hypothetical protein EGI22_20955 [Lacihabitans sp. LS3-19]|uniref:hypothetical protein n=1 Tax=Lacihabitans sp. LS3-19 TaxID=2487335 RepID=UPI0020CD5DEC|nr:hypothetical protein [Lacihabitans sp. LS3-19]MCP9770384.1 hypothetical protein [Lacihabitans sp. LS3-19]
MEIYLVLSLVIIGFVGIKLFRLGSDWCEELITDLSLSRKVNVVLLVLFYLFNAGVVLVSVFVWEDSNNQLVYAFSRIGLAMLCIGFLHVFNIIWILIFFHFKQ